MVTGERRREGVGVIETPRGTLFHYHVDDDDLVTMANLIVSTNNNQAMNTAVRGSRSSTSTARKSRRPAQPHRSRHPRLRPRLSCATTRSTMPLEVTLVDAEPGTRPQVQALTHHPGGRCPCPAPTGPPPDAPMKPDTLVFSWGNPGRRRCPHCSSPTKSTLQPRRRMPHQLPAQVERARPVGTSACCLTRRWQQTFRSASVASPAARRQLPAHAMTPELSCTPTRRTAPPPAWLLGIRGSQWDRAPSPTAPATSKPPSDGPTMASRRRHRARGAGEDNHRGSEGEFRNRTKPGAVPAGPAQAFEQPLGLRFSKRASAPSKVR